jgi:hypothetical protein
VLEVVGVLEEWEEEEWGAGVVVVVVVGGSSSSAIVVRSINGDSGLVGEDEELILYFTKKNLKIKERAQLLT